MRELKQGGLLSVVLPSYNEEASIPRAAERITELLTAADIPFELLFVDDGSKDGSWAAIQTQAARFPQVRGCASPGTLARRRPSSPVWPRPVGTARR